ncbi:hypothetical protein K431DRAFT_28042 [Polychaeton citri CBS 116435]|uniref:Uncharacterized protein n=1 Tax=Polychaeton citri CBS 116435 TaxID=1314669 RepID=A0A9P4USP3_9PEZI|nr:hypothetical protein K431DRAFT_28042 [Polychaeton citri CBS 116435]
MRRARRARRARSVCEKSNRAPRLCPRFAPAHCGLSASFGVIDVPISAAGGSQLSKKEKLASEASKASTKVSTADTEFPLLNRFRDAQLKSARVSRGTWTYLNLSRSRSCPPCTLVLYWRPVSRLSACDRFAASPSPIDKSAYNFQSKPWRYVANVVARPLLEILSSIVWMAILI